jgi:beta-N-acetylhexosaminidase
MSVELRKKIGQLFMVGFDALEANEHIARMIREQHIGGVILFRRNVHTPEQLSALTRQLQEINAEVSTEPLLIAIDQEGGMVMRIEQGVTPLPSAMAYQQAGSIEDCESLNFVNGDELRQMGINMNLAPVLDVNNNPLNPVIGVRAFGEDADTVSKYGIAAMRGMRRAGVIATGKHFPGHGDTSTDTHYDMASVPHDLARLQAVELAPFKAAIDSGIDAIMTAHVMFPAIEPDPAIPATLSKAVLTDLLRKKMGFDGTVISDCLEMAAISEGIGVAKGAIATLQAGADIVLVSHRPERQLAAIEAVVQAAERGEISVAQIDEAVTRVRRLKQSAAVSQWRERSLALNGLMKPEALALSRRVQKAALRIEGAFRPLDSKLPIALVTFEVRSHTEIDEIALARNKEPRSSMQPGLSAAGFDVREFALSASPSEAEMAEAFAFAQNAPQILVQSYNAVLMAEQQKFISTLPQDKLWLVAGRLPYDLDLVPEAQGRLASFGSRPASLEPVMEKLAGK